MAMSRLPPGFVLGLGRDVPAPRVAHLYQGTFGNVGRAMCKRGYNRPEGFSIFRGHFGREGVCTVCFRRAHKGLAPLPWPVARSLVECVT